MRNLTSTYSRIHRLEGTGRVTALTVDPETDAVFVAVEDGENVEIGKATAEGIEVRSPPASRIILLTTSKILTLLTGSGTSPHTLSLKYLPEDASLAVILSSGEISVISLADGAANVETVGAVEGGVQAAEWSPDDEQVVLVTGAFPPPMYGVGGSRD
jgi:hypothetical protein